MNSNQDIETDTYSEEFRIKCECIFWKRWIIIHGRVQWELTKARIKAHRGEAGLNRLLDEMNRKKDERKT